MTTITTTLTPAGIAVDLNFKNAAGQNLAAWEVKPQPVWKVISSQNATLEVPPAINGFQAIVKPVDPKVQAFVSATVEANCKALGDLEGNPVSDDYHALRTEFHVMLNPPWKPAVAVVTPAAGFAAIVEN